MNNQYFKCGCWISDGDESYIFSSPILIRCKKHQKNLQKCSWISWAKKYAPAQYRQYKKDMK